MKINQTKKIKNKEKLKISLLKKPNKITSSRTLIKNKIKEKLKINIVNKKLKKRTITNSNYKKYFRSFKKNSFIKKTLGIGIYKISSFFKEAGLNLRLKIIKQKLSLLKKVKIMVNKNTFNNELWSKLQSILTFYINLRNYKGIRHRYKYPVRGQRTHTNAKTRKKQNKKIKSIIKYDKKGKKTNKNTINKQSKKTSKKL